MPSVAESVPPAVLCDEHAGSAFRAGEGGQMELDLGTRALLVSGGNARIAHVLSEHCDVRVDLDDGSVAVHARNLRGGRLMVRTPRGDVTVKGTVFEVTFDAAEDQLEVAVDEGFVEVQTRGGERFDVRPGGALSVGAKVLRAALDRAARASMRRRLHLASEPRAGSPARAPGISSEPPPTVMEVEIADEAHSWRTGSVQQPSLPPEPKTSVTEDGRPMQKPRVIVPANENEGEEP